MTNVVRFVHQLRPLPAVDDELAWFFNQAESDMGLPSNFERALRYRSLGNSRTPEDAAEAAHRYRRVRGWLLAMPDPDAGVLQAAYEVRPWPKALQRELGRLTGIVVKLAGALDPVLADRDAQARVEMTRAEGLIAGGPIRENASVMALRRAAELRYLHAHRAYAAVRRSVGGSCS